MEKSPEHREEKTNDHDTGIQKVQSLEEAYELNQKKSNRIIGGMIWLKMETLNVGTAIDLSGLGLMLSRRRKPSSASAR